MLQDQRQDDLHDARLYLKNLRTSAGGAFPAGAAILLVSSAVWAAGPSESLRERVEMIQAGTRTEVAGASIAVTRALPQLYERRAFAPVWTPEKADQLLAAIHDARADGLDPADYHLATIEKLRRDPGDGIDLDLVLTDALARLGYHVLFGKVDPEELDPNWNFTRDIPNFDPVKALQDVIDAPDLRKAIDDAKPQHALYANLKAALAKYREMAWGTVPPGPTLRPGDTGPRVAALRARLKVTDGAVTEGDTFDDALAGSVKTFQARHGLAADGIAGARTIEEMNVPPATRIDQLRVNLERARWLLHDIGDAFVAVNIAGYELYLIENEKIAWHTPVQVGKPYRATPVFRSRLTYLVFNPTWTVPPGILANDILPAQKRDRGTLKKKGLEVLDMKGNPVDASAIDWTSVTASRFPYLLRQGPGPDNALGRVKFMFPNDHAVYLHDTPSKSLFDKDERAFSSGCIRVRDPLKLAEILLAGQKGWDRADIDRVIASGKTTSVTLAKPIPVWLTYWTAWVDGDGAVEFRRDLYGRDAKVRTSLDAGFKIRRRGV